MTERPALLLVLLLILTLAAPGHADEHADGHADEFADCIEVLADGARARGFQPATVTVLERARYQPRVIELDRSQPEFTTSFSDYFNRRVSDQRVARGRELLAEHSELLARVQRETGVPARYLMAFWGLETNFGSYLGKMPTVDSLATLACDPRRSRYFTTELMAALEILDRGDIAADTLQGSWAGALGHVQFMPSVYLQHAADGDGDARRDLYGSIADAMLSAGRFLAALGWQTGTRWGREVLLPEGFDYRLAWSDAPRPLREWRELAVTDVRGQALPALDLPARLRVPAGHDGPAFLTYANFDVIMRWNRSVFYALSVGHLADRIAGGGRLHTPPPEEPALTREVILSLQEQLIGLGFDVGTADGLLGPATRRAVSAFQAGRGLIADGHVDARLLAAVDAAATRP